MSVYRFQVIWKGPSGLASDVFVNTWHFNKGGAVPATDFDNVRDMLFDFYDGGTVSTAVTQALSPLLNHTATVKAYDLEEEKPRAPVYQSTFTGTHFSGSTSLPFECAVCLSFETKRQSGVVQARRRNRVFLGPLASGVVDSNARVLSTHRTNILNAAKRLHDASVASSTWDWAVWSTHDNLDFAVDHLWVDDSFDTQRRRGLSPTARTEFTY